MSIIENAIKKGQSIISEYESKKLLSLYNIPVVREKLVKSLEEAMEFIKEIDYPVVLKGFSPTLLHKSEHNLVELNLKNGEEVREGWQRILNAKVKIESVLVQKYIKGDLELIVGLKKDITFGPCVVFGLGGIFTEVLKDISIRVAPIDKIDAEEMICEIKGYKILEGYRGKKGVNIEKLTDILINVGKIGIEYPEIKELDINPLIVQDGIPIAVDALIILENPKNSLA
jgi:acetyl-CoA synthetase (ADP-forming)